MTTILAVLAALLALAVEPAQPGFTDLLPSTAVVVSDPGGFHGLEWQCYPDDDERCYAGFTGFDIVVGP